MFIEKDIQNHHRTWRGRTAAYSTLQNFDYINY